MNRALRLESILRDHDNSLPLGRIIQIIETRSVWNGNDRDKWLGVRHRFTAATSELRADLESRSPMETLVWTKGKTPGEGVYSIMPAAVRNGAVVALPRQLLFIPENAVHGYGGERHVHHH